MNGDLWLQPEIKICNKFLNKNKKKERKKKLYPNEHELHEALGRSGTSSFLLCHFLRIMETTHLVLIKNLWNEKLFFAA